MKKTKILLSILSLMIFAFASCDLLGNKDVKIMEYSNEVSKGIYFYNLERSLSLSFLDGRSDVEGKYNHSYKNNFIEVNADGDVISTNLLNDRTEVMTISVDSDNKKADLLLQKNHNGENYNVRGYIYELDNLLYIWDDGYKTAQANNNYILFVSDYLQSIINVSCEDDNSTYYHDKNIFTIVINNEADTLTKTCLYQIVFGEKTITVKHENYEKVKENSGYNETISSDEIVFVKKEQSIIIPEYVLDMPVE
jgi:hypothetical protein